MILFLGFRRLSVPKIGLKLCKTNSKNVSQFLSLVQPLLREGEFDYYDYSDFKIVWRKFKIEKCILL